MLSDELITKIGTDLDSMPLQPTSRRDLELLVSRIGEKIRTAQDRGATYAEIAKQITASGYPIKRSTLCAALMRHRKNEARAKHPAPRRPAGSLPARSRSAAASAPPIKAERSAERR
jgi:hypothetical protein